MVDAETNSLGYGAAVGSVFDVIDETQIREADRRLSGAAVPGGNVMLFGSHARGDAGDRSDQDILVIKAEVENAALEGGPLDARTTRPPAGRRGHRRQRKRCRGAGEGPGQPRAHCDHRGAHPRRLMADHRDLARELIGLAEDDRAAAAVLLDIAGVSDAIIAFHAQRAVEKYLKAVPASRGVDFPFTHNLASVFEMREDAGVEVPSGARRSRVCYCLHFAATAVRWAAGAVEPPRPTRPVGARRTKVGDRHDSEGRRPEQTLPSAGRAEVGPGNSDRRPERQSAAPSRDACCGG
ncbi:MAG: hypothetical protein QOH12_1400 [Solirubrobacteraceae bacterium]|jgi:HEPN domain-containing protein|nr:hypothetical protein [Solirubrobacteraceae bacterium]